MRRRLAGERGVTIVEAAFVLPILLMFMFGLVDLGLWTLNSNQATNAARDGARLGIIDFETADVPNSDMHLAIVEAVERRLNRTLQADDVEVSCVQPDDLGIACSSALVDVDRIRVEVDWSWDLVTPVAAIIGVDEGDVQGSATMAIVGRPLAPTAPAEGGDDTSSTSTDCAATVTWVKSHNDQPIKLKNNSNQLQHAVEVRFTTTGTCEELRVEFESPSGQKVPQVVCGCTPSDDTVTYFEYEYTGSDNIWEAGDSAYARIYDGDDQVGDTTFSVES